MMVNVRNFLHDDVRSLSNDVDGRDRDPAGSFSHKLHMDLGSGGE